DSVTSELYLLGESSHQLGEQARTYLSKGNFVDRDSGIAIRLLSGNGGTAVIGFEGLRNTTVAEPLAALATLMIERSNAFRRASQAAAATEAEMLRGAILDALAHEFKTPLAIILTAAGGLSDVG